MNCKILILFFSISFYSTTFSSEVKDFNEVRFFREAEDKSDKVEALSFILKELLFNPSKYWGKGYLFEGDDSDSPNAQIKSISGKDYFEIEYEYYNAQFTEKYRSKFAVHPIFASSIDKIKEEIPPNEGRAHSFNLTINNSLSSSWDNGIEFFAGYYSLDEYSVNFTYMGADGSLIGQNSSTLLEVVPYFRYLKEFNGKNEYRTTAYFSIELPITYLTTQRKETLSNFVTGKTWEFQEEHSKPKIDFSFNLGLEFWLDSVCIKPFTQFDTDFEPSYGIGIYKILGLYDSIFFIYETFEDDLRHESSFSIGFNIAR